ncbi:MAG: helix-turn-helix domain-containing protein [bacterium]
MNREPKKFLTISQAAKLFQVSTRTIYRWSREGRIRTIRIGQTVRIPSEEIENKIKQVRIKMNEKERKGKVRRDEDFQ